MKIWVDADACPKVIKQILFKASHRLRVELCLVANSKLAHPVSALISSVQVPQGFDGADEHVVEQVKAGDLVITADILLAQRIVKKGALALDPRGEIYSEENIGEKVATRNLMQELRSGGQVMGGPAPFSNKDSSRFAVALNQVVTRLMKKE